MLRRGSWCAKLLFFLFRHEYPEVERFEFKLVANLLSIDLRPVQIKGYPLTLAQYKPAQCVSMPRGPSKPQFLSQ